jgi:hypothetical protein
MKEDGLEELVFFDTSPIIAYRVWQVTLDDGEPQNLRSLTYKIRWKPLRPMRAHCLYSMKPLVQPTPVWHHPDEQCPCLRHTCGIYAMKDTENLESWGGTYDNPSLLRVVGRVSLWGKVLQHELGYRAEYAYPVSFVQPEDPEIGAWLEREYLDVA